MKKNNLIFIVVSIALVIALGLCYYFLNTLNKNSTISPKAIVLGETYPLTVEDALGDTITIEKKPTRIISLAPGTTEILFAVGSGDRVIGVSNYCHYPKDVEKLARVGDLITPNIEKITSLKPDLVIAQRGNDRKVITKIKETGFNVISVDPVSYDSLMDAIEILGKITEGKNYKDLNASIATLKKSTADKAKAFKKHPKILLLFSAEGDLFSAGPGTIIDEMITLSGGENIAKDAKFAWPQLSMEVVTAKNPEIIVITRDEMYQNPDPIEKVREKFKKDKKWSALSAVKNGQIYYVEGSNVNILGPRLINGLEEFYKIVEDFQK